MKAGHLLLTAKLLLSVSAYYGGISLCCAAPPSIERRIQRVIELTNQERAKRGVPPLKREDNLCGAASWMAKDMAQNNYFAHEDKQGRTISLRLKDFGYQKMRAVAENIAAGQTDASEVVKEWVASPNHSRNLFSASFREIGIGYVAAENSTYECYWVQDFGMRARVYPAIINEEQAQTDTAKVHLFVYGQDWASKMRFSNDKQNWTKWESFVPEHDWELEPGFGKKTVYVQIQNPDEDEPVESEDTIEYVAKEGTTSPQPIIKPRPSDMDTAKPPKSPPPDLKDEEKRLAAERQKAEEEKKKEDPPKDPPKKDDPPKPPPKKEEPKKPPKDPNPDDF